MIEPHSLRNIDATLFDTQKIDVDKIGGFIDYGGQYKVFQYGSDKVIKFPLNKEETYYRISQWGHHTPDWDAKVEQMKMDRDKAKNIVETMSLPKGILCTPYYVGDVLIQDLVHVLNKQFWNDLSFSEAKHYIDKLIELNITLWRYGIHEKAQNFTLNCGKDNHNNVVLFDYGEFTTDFDTAKKKVESGSMLTAWSVSRLPQNIQHYYILTAEEIYTVQNLSDNWGVLLHT